MIVLDTNVVGHAFLQGERTPVAKRVRSLDPDVVVPPLWRYEFLNVLTNIVRHGLLSEAQALTTAREASELLTAVERSPDSYAVLRAAIRHSITAYDAQFVVLAWELGATLVTEDRELLRKFPQVAVSMEEFCARHGDQDA